MQMPVLRFIIKTKIQNQFFNFITNLFYKLNVNAKRLYFDFSIFLFFVFVFN